MRTEIRSKERWDNLFYQGDFDSENHDEVRCIVQCPECFKSWFNIGFRDFDGKRVSDLVRSNYLPLENITNYQIAEIAAIGDFVVYKTLLEAEANYVSVFCKRCNTKHLIVLGITETQPTRYAGALQGVWLIRD